MSSRLNNVLIIGDPDNGYTQVLKLGMEHVIRNSNTQISVVPLNVAGSAYQELPKPSLVFLVLDDKKLYASATGLLEHQEPAIPIQVAWHLAESKHIVHVTVPSEHFNNGSFTPIDTLTLCLSGVSGIWEIEPNLLGQDARQSIDINEFHQNWRQRRFFLHGSHVATQLYNFSEKIMMDAWPTIVETRNERGLSSEEELSESQRMACFNLALGIAALEEKDLIFDSNGKMNLDDIATKLSGLADRTGCWMGRTVIAKYLGFLDRGWKERLPMQHDKKSRHNMPQWSRSEGFPKNYPIIRSQKHSDTGESLYQALAGLTFEREWSPNQKHPFTTISINTKKYWRDNSE